MTPSPISTEAQERVTRAPARPRNRAWLTSDIKRLKAEWGNVPKGFLLMSFPDRSWGALQQTARRLGLKRVRMWRGRISPTKDPLMFQLRVARQDKGLTAAALSKKIGQCERYVGMAERGHMNVKHHTLLRWCLALGVELRVEPANRGNRLAARLPERTAA